MSQSLGLPAASQLESKLINGQRMTRDETVILNLKLAKKLAAKYEQKGKQAGLEYGDLVSIGAIGLMKAFDDFNEALGYRFSTYAFPKIRGEIIRGIARSNTGLRYTENVKRIADRIQNYGLEDLSEDEIARRLGISTKNVKVALDYLANGIPFSFDMNVTDEEGNENSTLSELVGKEQDYSKLVVNEFIQILPEKEQEIVQLLLVNRTATEIGQVYKCTNQAILYFIKDIRKYWAVYESGQPIKYKRKYRRKQSEKEKAPISI